jgi:hypothetical protein
MELVAKSNDETRCGGVVQVNLGLHGFVGDCERFRAGILGEEW